MIFFFLYSLPRSPVANQSKSLAFHPLDRSVTSVFLAPRSFSASAPINRASAHSPNLPHGPSHCLVSVRVPEPRGPGRSPSDSGRSRPSSPRDRTLLRRWRCWWHRSRGICGIVVQIRRAFQGPLFCSRERWLVECFLFGESERGRKKKKRKNVLFSINLGMPKVKTRATTAIRIIGFFSRLNGETV